MSRLKQIDAKGGADSAAMGSGRPVTGRARQRGRRPALRPAERASSSLALDPVPRARAAEHRRL